MLRVYSDVRAFQLDARRLCERIGQHDSNLASQLRRSAHSVALNMGEGMASRGGRRREAYSTSLREARECLSAIEVAVLWGYIEPVQRVVDRLDKIIGTLVKLTMPR